MRLLRPSYSTNKFLICLESAKLPYQRYYPLDKISIVDWLNVYVRILTIVLNLKKETFRDQCRLKSILSSYQHYISEKIKKKYTERFIYNYIKSHKNTLKYNVNKKNTRLQSLKLKALTYIYIIYKILQSKHPVYTYFLLVTDS